MQAVERIHSLTTSKKMSWQRLQFSLSLTLDMYGNQSGELAFETSGVKTKQNKTKQHSFTLFHWCKTLYGLANPSSTLHRQTTSMALQGVKQFGIAVFTSFVFSKTPDIPSAFSLWTGQNFCMTKRKALIRTRKCNSGTGISILNILDRKKSLQSQTWEDKESSEITFYFILILVPGYKIVNWSCSATFENCNKIWRFTTPDRI